MNALDERRAKRRLPVRQSRQPCLAKAISDAGWGMFGTMLKYKAEKDGKTYIEVDQFFPSSKTCNSCLHKVSEMPLDVRHWDCPQCKSRNDRDVNAAKNIRDEALRFLRIDVRRFPPHIEPIWDLFRRS